jgi:hypothetical protein
MLGDWDSSSEEDDPETVETHHKPKPNKLQVLAKKQQKNFRPQSEFVYDPKPMQP